MKTHKLIVLLTTLSFILGCSKSDDDNSPLAEANPLRVSNYKVGTNSYNIFYDDDFKPILIEAPNDNIEIEYNNDGLISKHGDYQYTYDATGKISTLIDLNSFSSSTDIETITQSYDSSGRLIEIISSTPNSFFVNGGEFILQRNFFYDNANRLVEIIESSNGTNVPYNFEKTELEYDANGNINKLTESISQDGSNYTIDATFQYVYDTKKNPERLFLELANVSGDFIRFTPLRNNLGINFAGLKYVPKNNIISTSRTGNNNSSITETTDITYDNEYPIQAEREFIFNTTSSFSILTWSYEGDF